jgi:hypothetical protein
MKHSNSIILGLVIILAGCADTSINSSVEQANKQMEAKGSPFRYVAQDSSSMVLTMLPLPAGPTKAIPALAQQVQDLIAREELKKGRSTALLEEVRHLQDGREVWVLQSLSGGIAYVVSFSDPSNAKSHIRISGPTTYSK